MVEGFNWLLDFGVTKAARRGVSWDRERLGSIDTALLKDEFS